MVRKFCGIFEGVKFGGLLFDFGVICCNLDKEVCLGKFILILSDVVLGLSF